jgi:hypothetical protein
MGSETGEIPGEKAANNEDEAIRDKAMREALGESPCAAERISESVL